MKQALALFFLGLLCITLFYSCSSENPKPKGPQVFTGLAMTIPYRILIDMPARETQYTHINRVISRTFAEVDEIYNKWNPLSELSILNTIPAYQRIQLSPQLEKVLVKIGSIVELTGGMFDPTVETVERLWKPYLINGQEPSPELLTSTKQATGWHHVHIDNGFYYKDNTATVITLEGITRGLTVDLLAENITKEGYSNIFVEWGGEVRTKGHHPSGRPWNVTLTQDNDSDLGKPVAFISLSNKSIATTGELLPLWTVDNVRYNNIYNPLECKPMRVTEHGIASASVVANSCFLADALSKVALTFTNLDSAQAWADKISAKDHDIAIWLVARSPNLGKKSISFEQGL
ncbi:MAG: FAD:protein FMN transferase [Parachlamydiales bacterium]|jgi:thiamine biosynthesis lipoprotein